MKKKYGDLTIKEVQEICEKGLKCGECPLYCICPRRFEFPSEWKKNLDTEVDL